MDLLEFLTTRKETDKDKLEKAYVPYGVYSFAALDNVEKTYEFREELRELYYEFVVIGDNIIMDFPNEAPDRLLALLKEFNARLLALQQKFTSGSIALFKSNDTLYWVGVPTNKFKDRQDDIFADVSHRKLIKMFEDGKAALPDLYIWHSAPAVGKATWVDYDERGFLVAGGVVHKQFEDLVINLVANATEPLGMSQGIYTKDIKRDSDGTIIEYIPFEFTFLPHKNACNLLTAFTTSEE